MRWSGRSLLRNFRLLNVSGAPASASSGKALVRMAACGQTMAHFMHSMQISGSKIGISRAIERRSY